MPRISAETRRRIVAIKSSGYSVTQIQKRLADEDICVSKVTIYKLLKKYKEFRTVLDMPRRASVPRKLNADHVKFIFFLTAFIKATTSTKEFHLNKLI